MVRLAVLRAKAVALPGREYVLVLTPERSLSPSEVSRVLAAIRANRPRLEEEHGIEITGVEVRPDQIRLRFRARVMTLMPFIVYAVLAVIAVVGIAITAWKVQETVPEIPWALLASVAAVGFAAWAISSMAKA